MRGGSPSMGGKHAQLRLVQWAVQLELNAQIVRFPSGLETEFAAGSTRLRVYGFAEEEGTVRAVEVPLENTPTVQAWLRTHLFAKTWALGQHHTADIDHGVYLIPERFLATEAISYSTLGIHRVPTNPLMRSLMMHCRRNSRPEGSFQWVRSKNP